MKKDENTSVVAPHEEIEYLICQVASLWRRLLNHQTQHLDITGAERRVLLCISCQPGLTQIAIADRLEIEPQNLMRTLDKLQSRGWIEKKADAKDRRAKCLFLTAEGQKIIIKIKAIAEQTRPTIIRGIDKNELIALTHYLTLLRDNLTEGLTEYK